MMYSSYAVVADLFEAISATQNSCIMSMYTKYAMESSVIYECSTTRNSLAANISNSGAWGVLNYAQNNWWSASEWNIRIRKSAQQTRVQMQKFSFIFCVKRCCLFMTVGLISGLQLFNHDCFRWTLKSTFANGNAHVLQFNTFLFLLTWHIFQILTYKRSDLLHAFHIWNIKNLMEIRQRFILSFVHAPDNSIGKILNTISHPMELHRTGIALTWALPTSNFGPTCRRDFANDGVKRLANLNLVECHKSFYDHMSSAILINGQTWAPLIQQMAL